MKRFLMLSGLWAIGYGTRVMAADASSAPGVPPAAEPPASHQPESYMRVRSPEAGVRIIETATRTFHPANGPGPDIRLVGVTHIGEAAYYTAIQQTLDTSTLVLFEGVGRPDFVTQSPDTPEDRAAWTQSAADYVADLYRWHKESQEAWPADMAALAAVVRAKRNREFPWVARAERDGWGRPWSLDLEATPARIGSLGSDGAPGGDGTARDLWADIPAPDDASSGLRDIQSSIADALGLRYQLDAIRYDRAHFRNSDMTLGQIRSAMAGGIGTGQEQQVMRMLEGAPEMGPMMQGLVRMISASPQIRATVRAMMIDALGASEDLLQHSASGAGPMGRLMKVLIADRNQVVLEDLRRALESDPHVKSVALFYGAGHMADLEIFLVEDMNYRPSGTDWLPAFGVRLADTGMTESQWEGLRSILHAQMRQGMLSNPP